ncbi:unnamed protein product [Tetraodon nigroviridis]|uniref:(spotted green pufferfish) hypothetical protein n=1 Tax=Tetraodon nigroviridis TaxID=99883 RepID=Q4TGP9_TETNG|nr:unnamed protein product [Tetraodon nigroviridis]
MNGLVVASCVQDESAGSKVAASLLLSPGGPKFTSLMLNLAHHVMLQEMKTFRTGALRPPGPGPRLVPGPGWSRAPADAVCFRGQLGSRGGGHPRLLAGRGGQASGAAHPEVSENGRGAGPLPPRVPEESPVSPGGSPRERRLGRCGAALDGGPGSPGSVLLQAAGPIGEGAAGRSQPVPGAPGVRSLPVVLPGPHDLQHQSGQRGCGRRPAGPGGPVRPGRDGPGPGGAADLPGAPGAAASASLLSDDRGELREIAADRYGADRRR